MAMYFVHWFAVALDTTSIVQLWLALLDEIAELRGAISIAHYY
jgi:hypothetical protein